MKVTATIQARMSSSRLPGKVLMPLAGKPLLQVQIERVLRSRLVDEVVVATTTEPPDDAIVDVAIKSGAKVFRGSENDVLGRIAALVREHRVELHVELIGDSPFTDPHIVDETIGFYLKNFPRYDYVSTGTKVTYPVGMEVNVYEGKTLISVESKVLRDDPLREHVDIHLSKNPQIRCFSLEAPPHYRYPDIYLEVDTQTDYEMLSQVADYFHAKGQDHFGLPLILEYLRERPDLALLNQNEHRRWKQFKV